MLSKSQFLVFLGAILLLAYKPVSFKDTQLQFERVRSAYQEKEELINNLLMQHGLRNDELRVLIRAFKIEKQLQVWAKNSNDKQYKLLKTYPFCALSGQPGPKRREGDYQIPEGFYFIDRFNPASNFHLSLGINYPNASDRILASGNRPGGDVFIHGSCVTVGCIPLTNEKIKELYVIATEAKNNGQPRIPVYIFPSQMDAESLVRLKQAYRGPSLARFWDNLKQGYDLFNKTHKELQFNVGEDGRYVFKI
jgi:murein L,D-transpeptidase YafK